MQNIPDCNQVHPLKQFPQICFLKNVIQNPNIEVGDYTYYDDPEDSEHFEQNNVLYHFDFIGDKLKIGKFCALAKGVKFIMNGANHRIDTFSSYPFSIFGGAWAENLKYNQEYAPGIEVSNDNDEGGRSYEQRLNRINTSLFAYEYPSDKLPSFMQMEDLFPLRYDTSTHQLMMTNPSFSTDGSPISHWENLFTKDYGRIYNAKVGELFKHTMNL